MSDTKRFSLTLWLRARLAVFAMRHCGPALLYWTDPETWDDYMSQGDPSPRGPAQIPDAIFDLIQAKLGDHPDEYDGDAERIIEWLYSDKVMIIP